MASSPRRSRPRLSALHFVLGLVLATAGCDAGGSPAAASPVSGLPMASPEEVDLSPEALESIVPAMEAYVERGELAGVMTMVARDGRVVHWEAVGNRRLSPADPLERDDLFRVYSMTKPVTSVAIMMLVEEGRVALDDPVSDYIPGFADVTVRTAGGERVPAERPVTVQDLLTHTSGLTYGVFGDTPVDSLYRSSGVLQNADGLEDFADRVAELPLLFHPGARWHYGVSTDVLGRVVEVASGRRLEAFFQDRIFGPLRMGDTGFHVPEDRRDRFMANHVREGDSLVESDSPENGVFTRPPRWASGGAGLVSTASDYIRFAQMLLNGGRLDGAVLLQPETVTAMTGNRLPEGAGVGFDDEGRPILGFGLGFAVVLDAEATPATDTDGSFSWDGAANTSFWIDPAHDLIGMVWTQFQPYGAYPLLEDFRKRVYEAVR